jgi:RNA polymerase subunit RPABC4/transcription elongation factor Spt4
MDHRTWECANKMPSCWSCTVLIEQGATVCPFCGADQTRPVQIVDPQTPQSLSGASFLREWGIVIIIIVVAVASLSGIYWHNFGEPSVSQAAQAERAAAKSLRDLREILSVYALSAKDAYPTTLNSLGDRVSSPMQTALSMGYRLEYSPKPSSNYAAPRGFVILARPEKSNYANLCVDESGVVHATQENRPATVQDPSF